MKKILAICALIVVYQSAGAQNKISGKITDQNNHPLTGATVFIADINKGTVSDNKGNYELQNLPEGRIKVQFSFIGYTSRLLAVELKGGGPVLVDITLHQTAIEADEIVISGGYNSTQHENAVKIDVLKIPGNALTLTPNFAEILTQVPGVDMISKGPGVSRPVIRGLSLNDILVLNNGVRFENYQFSDHHPMGIDEFGIENVEIIKGPASLLYGSDALGGVINFIKEKPAPVGQIAGDYNLQLFSNSEGMASNIGIKGATGKLHGGLRFGLKSHEDYLQGGGTFVPNTRFGGNSFIANTGFNNRKMSLNLYYDFSSYKTGIAEEDAIDIVNEQGRGRKPEIFYMSTDNHLLSLRNNFFLNRFKLEVNSAFQKSGLIHFEGPDEISIEMALQTLTYETRLYLPSTGKSDFIIGFQGLNQLNTNLNNRETILLPDANISNYSAFALLQFTFLEKVKLQSGLRYDYKQILTEAVNTPEEGTYRPVLDKTYGSVSGSLGATYNPSERLLFRFNFASAYRTPNLPELTSNGPHEERYELGDPGLLPTKAYETDLSAHYHTDNVSFDLAGFYNLLNNYIYISPSGDTANSGDRIYKYLQSDARLYGFEARIHFHPKKMEWLHFETTFSNVTGKKTTGGYLPFIPANKIHSDLRFEKEKLAFLHQAYISLNLLVAFEQGIPSAEEEKSDGYTLFDIGIGSRLKVSKQLITIGLVVNNLFDIKYIDHLSTLKEVNYFNPGRNIALNLRVPFGLSKNP
jgi:iron complex outermembrane receptor protein